MKLVSWRCLRCRRPELAHLQRGLGPRPVFSRLVCVNGNQSTSRSNASSHTMPSLPSGSCHDPERRLALRSERRSTARSSRCRSRSQASARSCAMQPWCRLGESRQIPDGAPHHGNELARRSREQFGLKRLCIPGTAHRRPPPQTCARFKRTFGGQTRVRFLKVVDRNTLFHSARLQTNSNHFGHEFIHKLMQARLAA